MKPGNLIKVAANGNSSPTTAVLVSLGGIDPLLGRYWKVSDGTRFWFYREADMEVISESR